MATKPKGSLTAAPDPARRGDTVRVTWTADGYDELYAHLEVTRPDGDVICEATERLDSRADPDAPVSLVLASPHWPEGVGGTGKVTLSSPRDEPFASTTFAVTT